MKLIKTILLAIIFTIFINGCDKVFNIGEDIIPNEDLVGINITDTVTIHLTTKETFHMASSAGSYYSANYAPYLFLGNATDPVFGSSTASFMTEIRRNSYPDWDSETADLDSILLVLPLDLTNGYLSSPNSVIMNVSVYRVIDTLNNVMYSDLDVNEYTNFELLGSSNVRKIYIPHDTIDKYDTIALIIRLSDNFGNFLIENSAQYLNSTSSFHTKFNGLFVKCNNTNTGIYKIMTTPNSKSNKFGLVFYYKKDSTTTEQDTYNIPLNSQCGRVNIFSHDYTNSQFYNQLQDSTVVLDYAYLQSMAGTFIKVDMPGLKNLKDSDFVINKAELILKADPNSLNYTPIEKLWLVGVDTSDNFIQFADFYYSEYQGADYDDGEYRFLVTRIIQNYIDGVYDENLFSLYIANLSSTGSFRRTVLNNGTHSNPPKLVITYTKIK